MPVQTSDAPDLMDKKIRKVYIKNGRRRMTTDSGVLLMPSSLSRMMFGKQRGGKYSHLQETKK